MLFPNYRRRQLNITIATIGIVSLMAFIMLSAGSGAAPTPQTIVFVHGWPDDPTQPAIRGLSRLAKEFESKNPQYKVKIRSAVSNDKLLLELGAGMNIDLIEKPVSMLMNWAANGILEELDHFLGQSRLLSSKHIIAAALEAGRWRGRLYLLPIEINPGFGLVYNTELFEEAALDPRKPPRTLNELQRLEVRLTKQRPDGTYSQLGFLPWTSTWTYFNCIYTWASQFGGEMLDLDRGEVTVDDPKVAQLLTWMQEYLKYQSPPDLSWNAFLKRQQAIALVYPEMITPLQQSEIQYMITHLPEVVGSGPAKYRFFDGFAYAVPKASKQKEGAWKFMEFLISSDDSLSFYEETHMIPGYIPHLARLNFLRHPDYKTFAELASDHPGIGVPITLRVEFASALDVVAKEVLIDRVFPLQALMQAKRMLQPKVDAFLKRK